MRIGNVDIHGASSHQVTDCVHRHPEQKKETGAMKMSTESAVSEKSVGQEAMEPPVQWSPMDWLRNLLKKGRGLAQRLWGSDSPGITEENLQKKTGGPDTAQRNSEAALPQKTEEHWKSAEQMPPYFILPEKRESPQGIFQKITTKVHTVSGYLEKHLPFTHTQTGSSHAKQQNKEEDLRRRSRYRKEDTEIDCILTDDSYLLDSYNKKGEYSRLSTDNRKG